MSLHGYTSEEAAVRHFTMLLSPGRGGFPELQELAPARSCPERRNTVLTFVNTMASPIKVLDERGEVISSTPISGFLLQSKKESQPAGTLEYGQATIPLVRGRYSKVRVTYNGQPAELPPPAPEVFYLVSAPVLEAWPREDFLAPEKTVNDPLTGKIVGCLKLRLA